MKFAADMNGIFDLLAAVMVQAVEDYLALLALGLIDGDRIAKHKWPTSTRRGKVILVQTDDRISLADAEELMRFLYHGGAIAFYERLEIMLNIDEVRDNLICRKRKGTPV